MNIPRARRLNPKQLAEYRRMRLRLAPVPGPGFVQYRARARPRWFLVLDEISEWINGVGLGIMLVILTVLLFSAGCVPPESQAPGIPRTFSFYPELPCPGPLPQELRSWTERWSAATGIPVTVDFAIEPAADSIPVRFVDDLGGSCGLTTVDSIYDHETHILLAYSIESIELVKPGLEPAGCAGWGYTLAHEIGHVLAGPQAPHAASGVFMDEMPLNVVHDINADTLSDVCAHAAHCTVFAPEP